MYEAAASRSALDVIVSSMLERINRYPECRDQLSRSHKTGCQYSRAAPDFQKVNQELC